MTETAGHDHQQIWWKLYHNEALQMLHVSHHEKPHGVMWYSSLCSWDSQEQEPATMRLHITLARACLVLWWYLQIPHCLPELIHAAGHSIQIRHGQASRDFGATSVGLWHWRSWALGSHLQTCEVRCGTRAGGEVDVFIKANKLYARQLGMKTWLNTSTSSLSRILQSTSQVLRWPSSASTPSCVSNSCTVLAACRDCNG